MNIFIEYKNIITKILKSLNEEGLLNELTNIDKVNIEPPKDISHGDLATNAAMVLAKPNKIKPHELATLITDRLQQEENIISAQIAGPGFININLDIRIWQNLVINILDSGLDYGNSSLGKNQHYNIEYVSANPTGPMHIGHARGAVYGDALALLLIKAGYEITKEYYINDAGGQIDILAKSAFLRYKEANGQEITIPEGLYPGEYLKKVGEELYQEYKAVLIDKDESHWLPIIREFAVKSMMETIKKDLADLGIYHDIFSSEKKLKDSGKIEDVLEFLEKKDLLYQGILEPPKGKKPDDWEPRMQTLFKATQFGDDIDRALKKSDGSYTYFAADIAYHLDKIERGANKMAIILGADHSGYIKRLKAAVKALSNGQATIDIKIAQLVNFMEGGVPMKMSKRAGTFTTVRDVINEVGKDVIRFIMLTRKNDMALDFDLQLVKEQSKDNPVFYVQYAHARAKSVLRNAKIEAPEAYKFYQNITADIMKNLTQDSELQLIKIMASWPRIVEASAISCEPHRIAFYLQELSGAFHSLWNKGKDNTTLRFIIKEETELTAARLAMLDAMTKVIASGLAIFNIDPLEEMR